MVSPIISLQYKKVPDTSKANDDSWVNLHPRGRKRQPLNEYTHCIGMNTDDEQKFLSLVQHRTTARQHK